MMIKKHLPKAFKHPLTWLLCLFPQFAFAMSSSNTLEKVLNGLVDITQSKIAALIGALAIIGLGYSAINNKLSKERAVVIALGIGLIYGAGWVMNQLGIGV
ncbi:MAG: hypothetical protein CMF50_03790 [Legionellales bacterium]|nr:hypothetical protein [Legionellales bacterium]|tara:strand:+ start:7553 stop:7855 length:303 start_codon:yes stop_codon:yes gene_type:complete